jgi:3-dehydroquinate synthase
MTDERTVRVELGERSYDIVVGKGLLATAGERIKQILPEPEIVIITDINVADAGFLKTLEGSVKAAEVKYESIILPPGEQTKSFEQLEKLLNQLLELKPNRNITLVALGGGVIGDLTGFAASSLLRGVNFIQIPTTLLAMVDSSVGGKTGINTSYGKNLVGAFYQPKMVLADISVLDSLPERQFLSGYAEVVKYSLINNPEFFAALESVGKDISIDEIVTCCESKAAIVSADEKEAGQRALLNLGHTFAHALEAETGYGEKLMHGEAVSIGMVLAFKFSSVLGLCSNDDVKKVEAHLSNVGLPVAVSDIDGVDFPAEQLLKHIQHDKKNSAGKLVFILAKGIGKSFVDKDVDANQLLQFLTKETKR